MSSSCMSAYLSCTNEHLDGCRDLTVTCNIECVPAQSERLTLDDVSCRLSMPAQRQLQSAPGQRKPVRRAMQQQQ